MANAKSRVSRKSEPPNAASDEVTQFLNLLIGEIEAPVDMQKLLDKLPSTMTSTAALGDFLKAKDRAQRRAAFIQTELIWFRKYGWFMARIVMLFAILVIIYSVISRNANANFITSVVLGAAFYYALLVTLSNWRYREKSKKRQAHLAWEARKYQREVVEIAATLMKQHRLDPAQYPIAKPQSAAGLEERDDRYFIPLPLS